MVADRRENLRPFKTSANSRFLCRLATLARVLHSSLGMKTTIEIKTVDGAKKVKATVKGGIAAHKMVNAKQWALTHVASGLCFRSGFLGQSHAIAALDILTKDSDLDSWLTKLAANSKDAVAANKVNAALKNLYNRALNVAFA